MLYEVITCQTVVSKHGDYLLTLKDNQHLLYQEVDHLFAPDAPNPSWPEIHTADHFNKGHGRIEARHLRLISLLPNELDWPGIAQVFRLDRRFVFLRRGKVIRVETKTHYGLTSLSHSRADGLQLLSMKRVITSYSIHYTKLYDPCARCAEPWTTRASRP